EVEYRSLRHELRSLRAAERHHTRGVGNREAGLFRQDQWQHRAPVHRGARKKGGTLAWQLYNSNLQPEGATGKADGSPVWSFPAVFARPDGTFAGSTKRPRAWPASPAVPRLQPAFLALRSATARSPVRRPSHP